MLNNIFSYAHIIFVFFLQEDFYIYLRHFFTFFHFLFGIFFFLILVSFTCFFSESFFVFFIIFIYHFLYIYIKIYLYIYLFIYFHEDFLCLSFLHQKFFPSDFFSEFPYQNFLHNQNFSSS